MNTPNGQQTAEKSQDTLASKQQRHSSKNSIWWKRGENLVQHMPTGTIYARLKLNGKTVRASLDTTVFSVAKVRLPDKLKELRTPKVVVGTFGQYAETFRGKTNADAMLSPAGKAYRLRCLDRLEKSWVGLTDTQVDKITADQCEDWWNEFSTQYSPQFVNHVLGYLRLIIRKLARLTNDPTFDLKPVGIKHTELALPSSDQFNRIVEITLTNGTPEAQDSADMIRLLAFTGMRLSEAQALLWSDVDFKAAEVRILCAKRRRTSRESDIRKLPMNPALRALLREMHDRKKREPTARVCVLDGVRRSLARASKLVGIKELSHHSMRHFFASVCIESNVDMQTLSRWLGHSDGGVLAQRTYGHLRREHSNRMAAQVSFGNASAGITQSPKSPKK